MSNAFFDAMPSKTSFVVGFVAAILVLGTIGFVILASQQVGGGSARGAGNQLAGNPTAAPAPTPAPEPSPSQPPREVSADDHVRGDANAPITLIEYSDFQCPFCQSFHPSVQKLMEEYSGKVRWVYRHFPLSFHPNAAPAAQASECAAEQGKFWEFADALFANQDALSDSYYKTLAGELGLNTSQFNTCVTSEKYAGRVQSDLEEGSGAGVTGTPGSFLIGSDGQVAPIRGALPYNNIKSLVDSMLK